MRLTNPAYGCALIAKVSKHRSTMTQLLDQRPLTEETLAGTQQDQKKRESHAPFLAACVVFLAIAAGISLTGEFPINDDYIYTWSVRHLFETGQFKIPGTVASSIFPIYSGAFLSTIAGGFSYGLLRVLSFVFGLLGGAGLYLAVRQLGLRNREAALFAAVYLLNPLFVNVNFGFMTDVPALALNNWLLYFGLRLSKSSAEAGEQTSTRGKFDWIALIGAFLTVSLGVASRQTILAFIPATLILACRPGISVAARGALVALLAAWPALFYKSLEPIVLGACDYLVSYNGYKEFFSGVLMSLVKTPAAGFSMLAEQAVKVLSYVGLLSLPVTIPLTVSTLANRQGSRRNFLLLFALCCAAIGVPLSWLMSKHIIMPMSENLFSPPAVGTYCILSGGVPGWSEASRVGLTYFSALAAVLVLSLSALIVAPVRRLLRTNTSEVFVSVAALCAIGLLILQTTVMNLDRYYLFCLAPVLLVLAVVWKNVHAKKVFWIGTAACAAMFGYSYLTAWDCMNFQRERWNALEYVVSRGVPPLQIDGGPEFNYGYNMSLCEGYRMDKEYVGWPDPWRGAAPRNQWRWWPISGEQYIVAGSKMDGYSVVKTFPYFSPLKWRNRDLFVLKADPSTPIDSAPIKKYSDSSSQSRSYNANLVR